MRGLATSCASIALVLIAGVAAGGNEVANPVFFDTDMDGTFGDGWVAFGAAGFDDFFADGNAGHGVLFGDQIGNLGGLFQAGIVAVPGTEYTLSASVSFEASWDADARLVLEFYDVDDTTLLDAAAVDITPGNPGGGYERFDMSAVAPAGAAFVRPVISFDNAASAGSDRGATVDNVILSEADDSVLRNGGFEDLLIGGEFGTFWGTFGNAALVDFFGFGEPGHAFLFGDTIGNSGGVFQGGIAGIAGQTYRFEANINLEAEWDATLSAGLEFYAADDATKLGERVIEVGGTPGIGYDFVAIVAEAPAGTAFVRPVVLFDGVMSDGSERGASVDGASLSVVRDTQNLAFNGGLGDDDADGVRGDGWFTFGNANVEIEFFPNGNPGHATLFADSIFNSGGIFQLRTPALPGETYELGLDIQFESEWDAELFLALEFYAGDDATKLSEQVQLLANAPGLGYNRYTLSAMAPAGTAYVRPVVFFEFPLSNGPNRAATIDNISVTVASDNLIVNPGFEDWYNDGAFGDNWGVFGASAALDFFGNGNPGHASFFGDTIGNEGGTFQAGILATPGERYEFGVDLAVEAEWDGDLQFGLEFYPADNATIIDSTLVSATPTPGAGYEANTMSAVAPAGAVFVRPVILFGGVQSEGPSRTALADNASLVIASCPADLAAPFGVLDFFDVLAYLGQFDASDPAADLAAPFGVFDFFDVLEYLGLFDAGC